MHNTVRANMQEEQRWIAPKFGQIARCCRPEPSSMLWPNYSAEVQQNQTSAYLYYRVLQTCEVQQPRMLVSLTISDMIRVCSHASDEW